MTVGEDGPVEVSAWAVGAAVPPLVQVIGRDGGALVAPTLVRPRPREVLAGVQATLGLLGALADVDVWAVSRMNEDTWTGLMRHTSARVTEAGPPPSTSERGEVQFGRPVAREMSLCHHLLTDTEPTLEPDLAVHASPQVRRIAATWGLQAYVGVALVTPDGHQVGSLAGFSSTPLPTAVQDWAGLLASQSRSLQSVVCSEIAAVDVQRADRALSSSLDRDRATLLPDRRGWLALLAAEEPSAAEVGDPIGVTVVELAGLRTVRGLRRASAVVVQAAGDLPVARVGPRQLGVLAGGKQRSHVAALAALIQARLEGAGFQVATAHTMQSGQEPLSDTWARAERALVSARVHPGRE